MPFSQQSLWRFVVIRSNTYQACHRDYGAGCSMVWLTTAYINQCSRDDMLAFILCHEISHGICAHGKEKTKLRLSKAPAQEQEELSWKLEYEADEVGMRLCARAGYNPYAALLFFKLRLHHKKTSLPIGQNPHPSPAQPVAKLQSGVQEAIKEYEESNKQNTSIADWQKTKWESYWNPFHNYDLP
ncbi:peptidase M48 Ste24p [Glarea lozoyensis ATCC 20868]|uniref:Peptidase M48 Ste24p n=1 Tax=Glarea lozoyensis (strain ATCC 20868 / MF5171) TaxID=1116229 RepID=S3CP56_GLAL2|nr:peptidase M48 Ste24p [Glarea lozoyensis ATCC 20868]EPE27495.1 peptidase M48 Ste24p [Glarea lozoyensis ATCC 20868]